MTLPPYRTDRYPSDEESLSDTSYIASFVTPPTKFNAGDARCTSAALAPGREPAEDTADIHKSGVVKTASSWAPEAASSACAAARRNDVVAPKVDDSAGVAEALLNLQKKLSLLSHERALAERDLNALSDELSHGRSRRSRQRAGWLPGDGRRDDGNVRRPSYFWPDDEDDYKESHTRRRMSSASPSGPLVSSSRRMLQHRAAAGGRTQPSNANCDGSTAVVAPAPQQFPISAAGDLSEVDVGGERDQPSRATRHHIDVYLAAAVAQQQEEEETAPPADMNDAHADLSAAEARCRRLDARLALMRRALHTANSDELRGPRGSGSREQHCACGRVDCGSSTPGDRCSRIAPPSLRRAPTAGAAVSATKAVTRSSQRPRPSTQSSKTASRSLRNGSASIPRAADVGAASFAEQQDTDPRATKSSSVAATLRGVPGRRGPTAPTLSSATLGLVRPSSVAASSSAGCSRLPSHNKVACSEHANSGLAQRALVVRGGGPCIKTTCPDHQDRSDPEAARPVAPHEVVCCSGRCLANGGENSASRLRRLREEFTDLNREHRQLTLLVGDAIAAGRPSVDLERELDHLVARMDVKGDEIAKCVRTFADVCQPSRAIVASAGDVTCQATGRCKWPAKESQSSGSAAAGTRSTTASSSRRRRARSVAGAKSKASRSGRLEGGVSGSGSRRRRSTKAVCTKAKVVLLCRSRKPGGGGSYSAAGQLRRSKLEGRPDSDRIQHRVSWA